MTEELNPYMEAEMKALTAKQVTVLEILDSVPPLWMTPTAIGHEAKIRMSWKGSSAPSAYVADALLKLWSNGMVEQASTYEYRITRNGQRYLESLKRLECPLTNRERWLLQLMSFSKRLDGIAEWHKHPSHDQEEMLKELISSADTLRQFAMYFTLIQRGVFPSAAEMMVKELKEVR